uniref:Carbohydrate sulfotransferase n=1 Tax=Accipiter nisus TaxID=211598 RepID=A0A8B9NG03_9AVES
MDRPVAGYKKLCTPRLRVRLSKKKYICVILNKVIITQCEGRECLLGRKTIHCYEKGGNFNNFLKLRSKLDSHVANQLFVEHKHKFIYCEVPKVGCSNWKRTIFLLQADLNAEASEIEHDHIHQTSLIKKLGTYPPAIQKEFLNNYTKVMFTRHPLERLVSAYRDKLLHSEPFYTLGTYLSMELRWSWVNLR